MEIICRDSAGNIVADIHMKDEFFSDFVRISELAKTFHVSRAAIYKLYQVKGSWEAVLRHYKDKETKRKVEAAKRLREL